MSNNTLKSGMIMLMLVVILAPTMQKMNEQNKKSNFKATLEEQRKIIQNQWPNRKIR